MLACAHVLARTYMLVLYDGWWYFRHGTSTRMWSVFACCIIIIRQSNISIIHFTHQFYRDREWIYQMSLWTVPFHRCRIQWVSWVCFHNAQYIPLKTEYTSTRRTRAVIPFGSAALRATSLRLTISHRIQYNNRVVYYCYRLQNVSSRNSTALETMRACQARHNINK